MLDVGLGELIVIAILALLVFGPDRLPKVASDAAKTLRQIRTMAVAARKDLSDAAGLEGDEELAQTVRDLRDLDPRRALRDLGDEPEDGGRGNGTRSAARGSTSTPGATGRTKERGAPAGAASPTAGAASGAAGAGAPVGTGAAGTGAAGTGAAGTGASDTGTPGDVGITAAEEDAARSAAPADPDWT